MRTEDMKKGFTLVEVVITVGVIGIIAMITIPAVLTYASKANTIEQLKKAQSTLARSMQNAVTNNGPIANWAWDGTTPEYIMKNYFVPNLYIARDCGTETNRGCGYEYHPMAPGANESTDNPDWYKIFTNDGMFIAFTLKDKSSDPDADPDNNGEIDSSCPRNKVVMCGMFVVDVNGKKSPNRIGQDIFYFGMYSNGAFLPYGGNWPETMIDEDCRTSGTGKTCAAKIAKDGWEFCPASKCISYPYPN